MKRQISLIAILFVLLAMVACNNSEKEKCCDEKSACEQDFSNVTDETLDFYGITDKNHLSAASKRALAWPRLGNEWFIEYEVFDLKGDFAYEEGVVRRDPSSMIKVDGLYYCWYTRSTGAVDGFAGDIETTKVFPWDRCDIWYATSKDKITWKEQGPAVLRGEKGAYDDRSVFTVEIMEWEGKYYLCYQTVKSPYNVRVKNQVGLAWADSPKGPWTKSAEPILSPADNGIWEGEEQNRFKVKKKGDFDSHKVHDPCILPFNGKFYLYYKGEQMGEEMTWGGRQIRQGVAIADKPEGPYEKSPYNPISNSGHEICVWNYNNGIAMLVTTDGPEKNTIQWAEDGINFEIMSSIHQAPHAIGLDRTVDNEKEPTAIMRQGLTHEYKTYDWQYIRGFRSWVKSSHTAKGESNDQGEKEDTAVKTDTQEK